jgi:hypothetical protein
LLPFIHTKYADIAARIKSSLGYNLSRLRVLFKNEDTDWQRPDFFTPGPLSIIAKRHIKNELLNADAENPEAVIVVEDEEEEEDQPDTIIDAWETA